MRLKTKILLASTIGKSARSRSIQLDESLRTEHAHVINIRKRQMSPYLRNILHTPSSHCSFAKRVLTILILQILPVLELYIKGLIHYVLFYAWLVSLNICSYGSFLFLAVGCSVLWKYWTLFIHFLLDIWVVFTSGFMNLKTNIFIFVGYITRVGIAWSWLLCMLGFNREAKQLFKNSWSS